MTDIAPSSRLSKSRFVAGLQCHKLLWWRVHEPDAPELVPDADRQAIFDRGHRVGELARGQVPYGVLIDVPHSEPEERVRQTAEAMRAGAVAVYEAAFVADDVFVAADILERVPGGWRLIEVKASTKIKGAYLDDIAVQLYVLRRSGVPVVGAELMLLNRECVYPDLSRLFLRHDVTGLLEERMARVPDRIPALRAMLEGPEPAVAIGPQCRSPYPCPFTPRCWKDVPRHHITTLYGVGAKAWTYAGQGYTTVDLLPDDVPLSRVARIQRQVVRDGTRCVAGEGLSVDLAVLRRPLAVLDFETLGPPVPVWPGCRPFDAVPAQFSVRIQNRDGGWDHHEWLAEGPDDPRPELVRRLAQALEGAGTVLAYNASFEQQALQRTAAALPELAAPVDAILDRLLDALILVRANVYHEDFLGSFSLKRVLPALVPGMSYDGLAIGEGFAASHELERLLLEGHALEADARDRLRADLMRYCGLDTLAVVRLLDALESLARVFS